MKINVNIERLILEGLPVARSQGPLVQAAVEQELSRLLAEGGLSHELKFGVTVPSVSADNIRQAGGSPVQIGHQIARAVYGGIGR